MALTFRFRCTTKMEYLSVMGCHFLQHQNTSIIQPRIQYYIYNYYLWPSQIDASCPVHILFSSQIQPEIIDHMQCRCPIRTCGSSRCHRNWGAMIYNEDVPHVMSVHEMIRSGQSRQSRAADHHISGVGLLRRRSRGGRSGSSKGTARTSGRAHHSSLRITTQK